LALSVSIIYFLPLTDITLLKNMQLVLFNTSLSRWVHVTQVWHHVHIASTLTADQHIVVVQFF